MSENIFNGDLGGNTVLFGDFPDQYLVGDNLQILSNVPSECCQLFYIDPPYGTGRDFHDFVDKFDGPHDFAHNFLKPRLIECYRILKATGILVLHIEPKISHYVRMVMDEVFGFSNFQNEIVWKSGGNKKSHKRLARFHDVLLVYAKTVEPVYNPLYVPYSEEYKNTAKVCLLTGRRYITAVAHNSQPDVNPRPNQRYEWNGHEKQWYVRKEVMQQRHDAGVLEYNQKGIPRFKTYLDETPGVPIRDLWTDISQIQNNERLDYATQKPVKLIERVITLYSNKDDLVIDCFAGTGATGRACINLGRRYLLVDINQKGYDTFVRSITGPNTEVRSANDNFTATPIGRANSNPTNHNKIIQGDCFTHLDEIEDSSIHFCLTDPPYGLDRMDEKWDVGKVNSKKYFNIVTSLPAGMKYDRQQGYDLQRWMTTLSEKVYRVLKPGAFFCVFAAPRLYHRVACAIEDAGFEIRDMYEWLYCLNQPKAMSLSHVIDRRRDTNKDELRKLFDGWKTPQVKSNHEPIVFAQKPRDGDFLGNYIDHQVGLVNTNLKIGADGQMFPSNVLCDSECDVELQKHFLVAKPSKSEKGIFNTHKTVKPLALCEYLVALTTREGQTVLDPFAGSGTTLLAAKNLGRDYVGIELNREYIEIIEQRLSQQFKCVEVAEEEVSNDNFDWESFDKAINE